MGVDAKALLTTSPSPIDIAKWLHGHNAASNVKIRMTGQDRFVWIEFKWRTEDRAMAVFYDGECASDYRDVYAKPATLCSVGCWGASHAIMWQLGERFGGFVMSNDFKGDWEQVT